MSTTDTTSTGSSAVLDGLGAIVNRGSLTKVVGKIKTAEELLGPGAGPEKKKTVIAALMRDVSARVPALAENKELPFLIANLVEITVTEMNKAGELDAEESQEGA